MKNKEEFIKSMDIKKGEEGHWSDWWKCVGKFGENVYGGMGDDMRDLVKEIMEYEEANVSYHEVMASGGLEAWAENRIDALTSNPEDTGTLHAELFPSQDKEGKSNAL